ncbi:MAG TPA: serine hydrolase [Longimicrobiaceae bacterium]|nr:serine hydrolase [Longimicrobiaceae bacterium]
MRIAPSLRLVAAAAALMCAAGAAPAQQPFPKTLRSALEARIARHHGVVGLALLDPVTGEMLSIRGDETFPTASAIKVPILVALFHRIETKKDLKLSDPIYLLASDQMPGSGVLSLLDTPLQLTLGDAAKLMIAVSDNSATNLVVDKLGIRHINARMDTLGLPHTKLWAEVFKGSGTTIAPDSLEKYGLGVTTPDEMAKLLGMIYRGEAVSPEASKQMVAMLEEQRAGVQEIPRYMPAETKVAHKTGETNEVRNDIAIVYNPDGRDYVLTIFTKENEDQSWRLDNDAMVMIGELARVVQTALNPVAPSAAR